MKRYIRSSTHKNSPKKYIYDICEYLGWNVPLFTDPAAGGYRLRYSESSKEDAQQTVEEIKKAAADLNISIVRALVKPADFGNWYAYVVVPRYVAE